MIKERDINYEMDMMNEPTRFLQEEKSREGCARERKKKLCGIYKNKLTTTRLEIVVPANRHIIKM